ncbi:Protein Gemin2 [Gryllus bimaculatus]|nr:Protein Gemin2 [Gryllus bimaculatus]
MSYLGDVLHPALPVKPLRESVDESKPPSTAEEYLQRVVLEAAGCEDVVVAEVDRTQFASKQTGVFQNIPGCAQAPSHLTPSLEWQQKQVSDFSMVRRKLAQMKSLPAPVSSVELPDEDDEKGWLLFCLGSEVQISHLDKEMGNSETEAVEGQLPLVSTIVSMNQPTVEQILDYHINWLQESTQLTTQQGRWLYALLAALELPLTPEICFLLRTLARECSRLRALVAEVESQQEMVSPLNLLICLVALYFRQADLADV